MWPVSLIIGVTVVATVPLLVVGVWLAVSIERRRHRTLVQQHGMSRRLSIHRPNLSANENNYGEIPTPTSRVLRSGRPARIPAMWNSVRSEESVAPEPEPELPVEEPMPPMAKRQKRSSLSGRAFSLAKTKRQKKIDKIKSIPMSPLSAITEFNSTPRETPAVAELPTENSPKATIMEASPPQLQLGKTRKPLSQGVVEERPVFGRSVSMTSTLTAPAEPLPPLPSFDVYKTTRHNEPWRDSTTSLDTVGSSLLGTILSSPTRAATETAIPSANNGMQTFDFGFGDTRSARLGGAPSRQTIQGYTRGKTGITSLRPSVEYNGIRATSLESAYHQRLKATDETFRTINANDWRTDVQQESRTRHSMQDYNSILGKRSHLDHSIQHSPSLLRRPASVASENPYQWDRKPAFSSIRLSAGSTEIKKGHKRQNCVRIANLPLPEPRNRVSQMPNLQEEQHENDWIKIPGLTLLEASQPVLRARASLVDVRGSPSPTQSRPVLVPTRPQRLFDRSSNSSAGRRDSDVFGADPRTPEAFRQSARQWPLSPTPTNNIKRNSARASPYDSPTLPPPIHVAKIHPRKSLVKGPRKPPPSILPQRNGSPSPISIKHNSNDVRDDLRKSIMALRSMNSEGRLLDHSSRNYRAVGYEPDETAMSISPMFTSLDSHPYPRERRYGSAAFGARSKMSITMSPSGMSIGDASIWEDASVRGESPELEIPTVPSPMFIVEDTGASQPKTPQLVIHYPDPQARENVEPQEARVTWKEREKSMYGLGGSYVSPQGRDLGLRTGNAVLGTPGSLYDGDGFLHEV